MNKIKNETPTPKNLLLELVKTNSDFASQQLNNDTAASQYSL
jgi:hypothetical protein